MVRYRWQTLTNGKGETKGVTAHVGLDPTVYESGTSVRGPRTISRTGMAQVRRLLFLGAVGGVRGKGDNSDNTRQHVRSRTHMAI